MHDNYDDEAPFDMAEFDDEYLEEVFLAELDDALCRRLAGTKWEERACKLSADTPWEERVALFQAFRDEKYFPNEATYFLITWAVEHIANVRIDEVLDTVYEPRFAKIRAAHGLAEDEDWEVGEGPEEYQQLDAEFARAAIDIILNTFQQFGENKMAETLKNNPEEADRLYEAGHEYVYEELIDTEE